MKKLVVGVLHVGYWFMYLFVIFLMLGFATMGNHQPHPVPNIILSPFVLFGIIPGVLGFYTFYIVLFKRYVQQNKVLKLCIAAVLVSLVAAVISEIAVYIILHGKFVNWTLDTCIFMGLFVAFIAFVNGILGLVLKACITWLAEIQKRAELDKRNYEMEIALMKAQINPHFLFNTINNIDGLIQQDSVKASAYLNKLSDIMRFMLYETKTDKITLAKELTYIEKYIELQKIRTSNPNYVKYAVENDGSNLLIEPMLFIPFIENAFKHAENKKTENAIDIRFKIENGKMIFECKNYFSEKPETKYQEGGLGNELIQKRLDLLYPAKHTLKINKENNTYKVQLTI